MSRSEAGTPLLKSRDPHLAGGEKNTLWTPQTQPPIDHQTWSWIKWSGTKTRWDDWDDKIMRVLDPSIWTHAHL